MLILTTTDPLRFFFLTLMGGSTPDEVCAMAKLPNGAFLKMSPCHCQP